MLIAIPADGKKSKEAKISPQIMAKFWALIDFDGGEVKSIEFVKNFEEAFEKSGWIDFVVLDNKFENYIDIMEYGPMILVRRPGQDTLELIIEGFKFKELDEIGL
jgi:predicted Fe-Mo cluster-binding NifX family protein